MREDVQHLIKVAGDLGSVVKTLTSQEYCPADCLELGCRVDIKLAKNALYDIAAACDKLYNKLDMLNQQILHEEAARCERKKVAELEIFNKRLFEFNMQLNEVAERLGIRWEERK